MFLVGLMSWWYREGLIARIGIIKNRIKATANSFSIDILISTMFKPYKQISVIDKSNLNFNGKIRAFFDELVSRVIGAVIRFSTLITSLVVIFFEIIINALVIVSWIFLPLMPMFGLIFWILGLRI